MLAAWQRYRGACDQVEPGAYGEVLDHAGDDVALARARSRRNRWVRSQPRPDPSSKRSGRVRRAATLALADELNPLVIRCAGYDLSEVVMVPIGSSPFLSALRLFTGRLAGFAGW